MAAVPDTTRHPLLEFLDAADKQAALRSGSGRGLVERIEKRELRGSGEFVGAYNAYVLGASSAGLDRFLCVPHVDVAWAAGVLVYGLYRRFQIPVDATHLGDCCFALADVLLKQELKSWFRAEYVEGKCVARPIIKGLDTSSPGHYHSVYDYIQTTAERRGTLEVILRIDQILIPRRRCGGETRDYTLKADDAAIRYREDATGRRQVTAREGTTPGRRSPEELLRPPHRDPGPAAE